MISRCFTIIGLILNFAGTLFLAFAFRWGGSKREGPNEMSITIGPRKYFLMIGIWFLAIGFVLQIFGVIF